MNYHNPRLFFYFNNQRPSALLYVNGTQLLTEISGNFPFEIICSFQTPIFLQNV
jgi:hypothetical protein